MNVTVCGVTVEIDGCAIVDGVTIDVPSGSFHAVIGPNGSGKSTLLRSIYRSLRPRSGNVLLGNDDVWRDLTARQAARRRAVVAQDGVLDLDFTVHDVVMMGRAPHKGVFERDSASDTDIVAEALTRVEMTWAAHRHVTTLSGGERQRVFIARAIAQQAPILVLDEPTNHLDVRSQHELIDLIVDLGVTTIAALHDLDQAAGVCDGVTVMQRGKVAATGTPDDVLTPSVIHEVFGVEAHIGRHPLTGRRHITTALPVRRPPTAPDNEPGDPSC